MRNLFDPLLLVAFVPACALGEIQAFHDDLDAHATESGGSTGDAATSGTWPGPVSTVTTATTSATTSASGESTAGYTDGVTSEADATSGEPAGPPAIGGHSLMPEPITAAGAIDVKIWADRAEGVRMDLGDVVTELTPTEPGLFEGEIQALTGFDHGGVAVFTPWRGDDEGEALEVPYTIQLPEPGSAALWSIDYGSGSGQVSAIGALPEGGVVELVTLVGGGTSGCYLRRRDEEGGSGPEDLVALLPDHCKGIDLAVGDDGIHVLIEGETTDGAIWWLARLASWGAPVKSIGYGGKDEVAHALALSPSGTIAVCGSAPTVAPFDLTDAMARIYRPDLSEHTALFDHAPGGKGQIFDERALGCDFLDDERLVVVGQVYGRHDNQDFVSRNRRFNIIYDLETDQGDLRVASAGLGATQSFATDVAVADGDAFVLGYVCGSDACDEVEGRLWTLDSDGDLTSTRSLGLHSTAALGPSRLGVSPAGYLVVTSGGLAGGEEAFLVRAYDRHKAEPLFSYVRQDAGLVHLARPLALGAYGQIYVGGFGASGYPLFVIIHG